MRQRKVFGAALILFTMFVLFQSYSCKAIGSNANVNNIESQPQATTNNQEEEVTQEDKEIVIGLSLPSTISTRWLKEKELMEAYAKEKGVTLISRVAQEDAEQQAAQVDELLNENIDILILAPVDAVAAASSVEKAHALGKKVIAYDRIILNTDLDLYVTFDSIEVGKIQGAYLAETVPEGNYLILSGDPGDYNSTFLKQGAMKYIDPLISEGKVSIVTEQAIKNWDPEYAYQIVKNVLETTENNVDAILAPNDSTAAGVIQALSEQGLAGKIPVTGQDAEIAALQRIVEGTQSMTVFKDPERISQEAIDAAIALVEGKKVVTNGAISNKKMYVPSILLPSYLVTKDNIEEVLINQGYFKKEDIYQ